MPNRNSTSYPGVVNLEVMADAHNYNAWLTAQLVGLVDTGARVLDYGAGSGTFAERMREARLTVTCVEPDPSLRSVLQSKGLVAFASLKDVPQERLFDLVYSLNVIEHIEDDADAVREMAHRVCPGGLLLLYVPAFSVLFTAMDRAVGHFRRYRIGQLKELIGSAGLQVIEANYADSLGFAITLAYRMIGSRTGAINPLALKIYDRWLFPVSRRLDKLVGGIMGKNALVVARKVAMPRAVK